MRPADREVMIMPEWLIHRYHQEERIDETDQDQQHCYVTDQEVRDKYYSSTPDILTKDDGGTDADERSRREGINLQYEDQNKPIPYPEVRSALQGLNSGTSVTQEELVPLGVYPSERAGAPRRASDAPGLPTEVHAQGGTGTTPRDRQAGGGRQAPHLPSRDKPAKEDLAANDTLD
jgi:hypothetical protein